MIIDTSVWVALLDKDDSCHPLARELVENIHPEDLDLIEHIYSETITVLRRKDLEFAIYEFLGFIAETGTKIQLIDQFLFKTANNFFLSYKRLSFTDCTMLAFAQQNQKELFTFDKQLQKAYNEILGQC